ncbi:MAG: hypothetical protein JXA46_17475 [Dehalococcoidales bacterium]|nr:hypothetical protein [Dehalococcoidales bacterium]
MAKSRYMHVLLSCILVFTLIGAFSIFGVIASAEDEPTAEGEATPTPTPKPVTLNLKSNVPAYSDDSGSTFNYDVVLEYTGDDRITVNLTNTEPQGWYTYIQYLGKQINSIDIGPAQYGSATANFTLYLSPDSGKTPDPGEYTVNLKATSGELSSSLDLKANVKAKYYFILTANTGRLSTTAEAGKENHYTLDMTNSSSVPLENISLNATKPENWIVTFTPERIEVLDIGQTVQIEAIITPPSGKTIAGDYMVTMRANNEKVNDSIDVRVTATTPSIWGWVGIIIVVVVIAIIVVLFMRLGRR